MTEFFLVVLILGLQIKHFLSDYLLQTAWMIQGKVSFGHAGGYVHAGIHVVGTALVLAGLGVAIQLLIVIVLIEFIVHYLLDFAKEHVTSGLSARERPHRYWALHGLDQLLHQLTYLAIVWAVFKSMPA